MSSLPFSIGPSQAPAVSIADLASRAEDWLLRDAFGFWVACGLDRPGLGFHEDLTLDGAPGCKPYKRLRTQCRQIYAFAEAQRMGWDGPAADAMQAGFEFILAHGRNPDGTWARLLGRDGGIYDATADLYDHAFVLFACAAMLRVSDDPRIALTVAETRQIIRSRFQLPGGMGYRAEDPAPATHQQNPHMHLLEAFLALFEATGDGQYLDEAARIVDLFQTAFFTLGTSRLFEEFDHGWQPVSGPLEPGHHFEWVDLLDRCASLGGPVLKREMTSLYSRGCIGTSPQTGLIADAMDVRGNILRASSRCWPNTEALRAHIAIKTRFGLPMDGAIRHTTEVLLDRFLAVSPRGAWMDQFDEVGHAAATTIPASTFYHLIGAFSALIRHAEMVNDA